MSGLENISYSRAACISAVRDYYKFLTKMYLDEADIVEAPTGGWPNITGDVEGFEKTNKVISLLRHLPYIRDDDDNEDGKRSHGAAQCHFADWEAAFRAVGAGQYDGESMKVSSENAALYEDVPPHVVGLTMGEEDCPVFLLDTKLGVVHWYECPAEIRYSRASRWRPIMHDPYEYAPENEAEWRADAPAWGVAAFFEMLKQQFRTLNFVPLSSRVVRDVWTEPAPGTEGMLPMLQGIYRAHEWPDLERYRKEECLEAVRSALEEHYPNEVEQ